MDRLNTFKRAIASNSDIYTEVSELTKNYQGTILDVGAGEGRLTEKIFKQGHRSVYACDLNPEYFAAEGLICDRCNLNYERLPYSASMFDVVICAEVIEHLENPRHLMREIYRVLKIKGKVIISMPNNLSLRARLSFFLRGYSSYLKKGRDEKESMHITMLTRLDLLRIFRDTGFKLVRTIYTRGAIPKTHIYWQAILPFLKGELFADNIILLAEKL